MAEAFVAHPALTPRGEEQSSTLQTFLWIRCERGRPIRQHWFSVLSDGTVKLFGGDYESDSGAHGSWRMIAESMEFPHGGMLVELHYMGEAANFYHTFLFKRSPFMNTVWLGYRDTAFRRDQLHCTLYLCD